MVQKSEVLLPHFNIVYDPNTPRLGLKVFMDAPRGAGYGENIVGPKLRRP